VAGEWKLLLQREVGGSRWVSTRTTGWRDDRREVRDIEGIYLGIVDWVNIWGCSEVGVSVLAFFIELAGWTLNGLDRLHVVSPCKGMFFAAILEQLRWGVVLQVVVLQVVQVVQEKPTRCFSKGSSAAENRQERCVGACVEWAGPSVRAVQARLILLLAHTPVLNLSTGTKIFPIISPADVCKRQGDPMA